MREFIGGRPGWSIDREMGLGEEVIKGLMQRSWGDDILRCETRLRYFEFIIKTSTYIYMQVSSFSSLGLCPWGYLHDHSSSDTMNFDN